ncbi:MAG: ArsR family transcriptional regulator [Acholeplasmatales bacterium]|nr:MAG: ArsR family transcriptional regulator [Acholeplasmatales bacterium]
MSDQTLERVFKALADKNRLNILKLLRQGERCGCDLLDRLDISQPTLSHHLKVLSEAGLVNSVRQGNRIEYRVALASFNQLNTQLDQLIHPEPTCEVRMHEDI